MMEPENVRERKYPLFDEFFGMKIKPFLFGYAETLEDGCLSVPILSLACDPLSAYCTPDGIVQYFYGGGKYETVERGGEKVTEYRFADLGTRSARETIRSALDEE